MRTINVVAIKKNGLTITDQANNQAEAAKKVQKWLTDPFYASFPTGGASSISRVFFGDEDGLLEYTLNEIAELAGVSK